MKKLKKGEKGALWDAEGNLAARVYKEKPCKKDFSFILEGSECLVRNLEQKMLKFLKK